MTDISITAANVIAQSGSTVDRSKNAGETITAGQAVYLDSTTKEWMKADSNSATAAVRQARGIALNGAADGQPLGVLTAGDVAMGAVFTAGVAVYLSDTPGGICPVADVGSGEYVCLLGVPKSTSVLTVDIQYPNVQL